MKSNIAFGVALLIIVAAGYFVIAGDGKSHNTPSSSGKITVASSVVNGEDNSVIKDGVQYVTIFARGGYTPRQSSAKAGLPTKLIVKTNGTYDCSSSLAIHSLNYRAMLPNTGETVIDAGTFKEGEILQGICAMGMYSFTVTFK